MFVVWIRLLSLLFLIPAVLVFAADDSFTSSFTYCSLPDVLVVQQFDVTYFQQNNTVWVDFSGQSIVPNVSVSANVQLSIEGVDLVNITLDLCSTRMFGGVFCPLPTYTFTGSDSIALPSSVFIPSIVFQIPELSPLVQLSLNDVTTGELKACVQASLSDG